MFAFKLGLRSLFFRRKQYISLLAVCIAGVGISLFCLFLMDGMLRSLSMKSKIYYGGDLQFIGGNGTLNFSNVDETIAKIEPVFPSNAIISPRYDFSAGNSALYFEGTGVRQRVIKGVDFTKEDQLFSQFTYVSGDAKSIAGTNGILLSDPIAKMLCIHTGDSVTLMLKNIRGYTNTVQLEVKGIFKDSSLFGMYTSYMDIDCLRLAYGCGHKEANRIGVFFPEQAPSSKDVASYQSSLEKLFTMFPQVTDKQLFYDKLLTGQLTGETYALITLFANLQDVRILIDAMHGIAAFIIIILILIIVIGISSTYRVLIMKRSNEIGIYKAIGMERKGIMHVLLSETLVLLVCGCAGGFLFAFILCKCISFWNLSFIPAFDIFLSNGILVPLIKFLPVAVISLTVIVTTVFAVLFSVKKTVIMTPIEALAVTE